MNEREETPVNTIVITECNLLNSEARCSDRCYSRGL